jgi:glutamyl-tRNA synthetase
MARRGIEPEAVRNAVIDIGTGDTDIQFSWENLYAKNKEIIDKTADRYFFVPDPVLVDITGSTPVIAKAMRHPGDETKGFREIPFSGSVFIPGSEVQNGADFIRLKDLFNIRVKRQSGVIFGEYAGDDLQEARSQKAPIVQWLPKEHAHQCLIRYPEGDVSGLCEPESILKPGRVVQYERVGFVRIDNVGDPAVAYFAHR